MTDSNKSVQYYKREQAARYDRNSNIIRGSREWHAQCLRDILAFLEPTPCRFLELGSGTGFFTSVIATSLPTVTGVAIDGSEAMLAEAATALSQYSSRLELREHLFSEIPWGTLGKFDIVFSAFAIHHLDDAVKQRLYQEVSSCLLPKGCFVLFDPFRPYGRMADKLLERLTCLDILRRYKHNTGKDVSLAKVIETDRRKKLEQGDKESSLEFTLRALTKANLSDVAVVFAEARLAGLVAFRH